MSIDRLAQCRIATNFQVVKNGVSMKYNKGKYSKTGFACVLVRVPFKGT